MLAVLLEGMDPRGKELGEVRLGGGQGAGGVVRLGGARSWGGVRQAATGEESGLGRSPWSRAELGCRSRTSPPRAGKNSHLCEHLTGRRRFHCVILIIVPEVHNNPVD